MGGVTGKLEVERSSLPGHSKGTRILNLLKREGIAGHVMVAGPFTGATYLVISPCYWRKERLSSPGMEGEPFLRHIISFQLLECIIQHIFISKEARRLHLKGSWPLNMKVMSDSTRIFTAKRWAEETWRETIFWERVSGVRGDALVVTSLLRARASCSSDTEEDTVTSKHPLLGPRQLLPLRLSLPCATKSVWESRINMGFVNSKTRYNKKLSHQFGTSPNICLIQTAWVLLLLKTKHHKNIFCLLICDSLTVRGSNPAFGGKGMICSCILLLHPYQVTKASNWLHDEKPNAGPAGGKLILTMQTVKFGSSRWDEELVTAVFAPHPSLPSQSSAPSADVEQKRQHRKAFNLSVPAWKAASQRYKPADERQVSYQCSEGI